MNTDIISSSAQNDTNQASREFDEPVTISLPEEESRKWRTPGFQRMRLDWRSEDRPIIQQARATVDQWMQETFAGCYLLMHRLYSIIREPLVNADGEIITDAFGKMVWKKDEYGRYIEDFTRLNHRQKEAFMVDLTINLVFWEQRAADAWGESMFAKASWEERQAIGYDAPTRGTVDDRHAKGTIDSREERYFAILQAYRSRKADAMVRSMERLAQRLKDSMVA